MQPDVGAVGKRTLVQQLEVQRAPGGGGGHDQATNDVHAAATRGTSGSGGALPHLDIIQALFGRHDVSHVKAHTDGAAREGAQAMGAQAFASGDHVAFAGTPDLHTAAHEAAHIVQQRGGVQLKGGVGAAGDAYERHADEVADRVVRGESAEALLDQHAGGGGGGGAIQRKIEINATKGPDYDAMAELYKVLQKTLDGPETKALQEAVASKQLTLVLAWRDSAIEDDEMGSTYPAEGGKSVWVTVDRSLNWKTTENPQAQAQATSTVLHEFILHATPLIQRLLAGTWRQGGPDTEDAEHGDFIGWSKVLGAAGKLGSPVVYEALTDAISHVHMVGEGKTDEQKAKMQATFLSMLPGIAKTHGLQVVQASADLVFVLDPGRSLVTALVKHNTGWLEPQGDEDSLKRWNQLQGGGTTTSQPIVNNSQAPTTTQAPLLHPSMQPFFRHGGTLTSMDLVGDTNVGTKHS